MWLINLMKERFFSVTATILDPFSLFCSTLGKKKKEMRIVGNFVNFLTQLD